MRTVCEQEASALSHEDGQRAQKKRPVVLIAERLGRGHGGAEIYLTRLVQFLARSGHPVKVYLRRPFTEPLAGDVRVEVVHTMRRFRMVWERAFARRVARRLDPNRDIVLSTLPLPGIGYYQPHSGLYSRAYEAMSDALDSDFKRGAHKITSALNLRRQSLVRMQEQLLTSSRPPRVMTFSRAMRAHFVAAYPEIAPSIVTAPIGVELERFYPGIEPLNPWRPERRPERPVLLFAAQNFRLKGLANLLSAFRDALRRGLDADLLVVGNKRGRNRAFIAMAAVLGVGSRVRFLGEISDSDMERLYRSCDALIHPTFSDHCSLVVVEALASGLPVVTTRQNGAAELMESGKHGFILDSPADLGALSSALLVLGDPAKRAQMSAAAASLRPQLDFAAHAREVMSWLTADQLVPAGAPN